MPKRGLFGAQFRVIGVKRGPKWVILSAGVHLGVYVTIGRDKGASNSGGGLYFFDVSVGGASIGGGL